MDKHIYKLLEERNSATVRLVGADANGRKCFVVLKINADEFKRLQKAYDANQLLDVYKYGEVIETGWYEETPASLH